LLTAADSRYQSILQDNTILQSRSEKAQSLVHQTHDQLEKLRSDYETLRLSVSNKDLAVSERQSELASVSGDRRRLLETNTKQQAEIDRLTRDVSSYSDKTVQLSAKIADLQTKLSDADAERLPLQFKLVIYFSFCRSIPSVLTISMPQ
jgi:predicted  nucleic acid-binding Zn-ribbon protein